MKLHITGLLMAIFMLSAGNTANAQLLKKRPAMVTGKQEVAQMAANDQHMWFGKGIETYRPNAAIIARLQNKWTSDLQIIAFGGSWCPDTHREMPAFFKCLQDAEIPEKEVDLYFLDRKMQSGTDMEEKYNVSSVPVFVILRNGKEIGRINDKPGKPAEELLLKIIQ